jgi:hypothetical protein
MILKKKQSLLKLFVQTDFLLINKNDFKKSIFVLDADFTILSIKEISHVLFYINQFYLQKKSKFTVCFIVEDKLIFSYIFKFVKELGLEDVVVIVSSVHFIKKLRNTFYFAIFLENLSSHAAKSVFNKNINIVESICFEQNSFNILGIYQMFNDIKDVKKLFVLLCFLSSILKIK